MRRGDIGYYLILGLFKALGSLPLSVLYGVLSPLIYLVIYRIAKYRVRVTRDNLANSFPEKSESELRDIERKFYRHLSDLFIDNVKMSTMSDQQMRERMIYENIDELPNGDVICAMGHYGSWELSVGYGLNTDRKVVAIYRPLHSQIFDRYYAYIRQRFGTGVVPMQNILREIISHRRDDGDSRPMAIAMIADQTPPRREAHLWYDFLNQQTPFFVGVEKLAIKFNISVQFMNVVETKRGYYSCHLEQIYDGYEEVEHGEITRRYVEKLEAMIRRRPELWVWSHRRWKHKKR